MKNVYESVDANRSRSMWVITFFILFVMAASVLIAKSLGAYMGYETTGLEFTGIALIVSGITSFASYYFSDRIILTISSAKPASRQEHFAFYTVTENLCMAAGLPMPKLYVIDDTAPNAFATGRDPQHAVVCATTGLLQKLNRTELEGVIGHELSHIANYDIRLMSIVVVLVGMLTLIADWLLRISFHGSSSRDDRKGSGGLLVFIGLILALLSPLIARLIQLAISRDREYLADASSAKLTRQPSGLASALAKLESDREPLEAANKATAHLYITNPLKNHHDAIGQFANLFNTHPPIKDRIARLSQMA